MGNTYAGCGDLSAQVFARIFGAAIILLFRFSDPLYKFLEIRA
jgi:hypothetical protein